MIIDSIVYIRILSAAIFFATTFISFRIYLKTDYDTFWFLVAIASLIGFLESFMNALEWINIFATLGDIFGEYLITLLLLIWIIALYNLSSINGGNSNI